jgi:predicted NACHT family NTPase
MVELRKYVGFTAPDKSRTFLDYLDYLKRKEGLPLGRAALEGYLSADGRVLFLFDGLDEIFDPEQRREVIKEIAACAEQWPKAHFLVTSRIIGYQDKLLNDAGFDHYTVQDLGAEQIKAFTHRWYALALHDRPQEAEMRCERLLRACTESPSVRQLAGNPMLLTIMAIIGKNQELPRERWEFYDHAAGVLIEHWDVNRFVKNAELDMGKEEKKELLRRLAFRMQGGAGSLAGNYIHRDQLREEFEAFVRERFGEPPGKAARVAQAMINQFRERNFILSLYGANFTASYIAPFSSTSAPRRSYGSSRSRRR